MPSHVPVTGVMFRIRTRVYVSERAELSRMFTIATQHVLSNTTVHRPLGTLKADVLV